jgi:hypothetical protein
MLDGAEHEDARAGGGADNVVDNAGALEERYGVPEARGLGDRRAGRDGVPMHPALCHGHAGRVRDDRLLEGDLGAVREARHHRGALAPLLREARLGRRRAVGVLQALDVAAEHGADADALHEAEEVHLDARLVAVDIGVDDAGRVGAALEQRPEGAVELGVHQDDVLAVLDGGQHDGERVLHRAGDLEKHVDMGRGGDEERVFSDRGPAGLDGTSERRRAVAERSARLAGIGVGGDGLLRRAVCHRDDAHGGGMDGVDLEEHARGHEARADHADADWGRAARGVAGERGIHQNHGLCLSFIYTREGRRWRDRRMPRRTERGKDEIR